jgi:hypothetical protein
MPKEERPAFQLDDADGNRLQAAWSGSGQRLMISLFSQRRGFEWKGQAELTLDQVKQFSDFLVESRPR